MEPPSDHFEVSFEEAKDLLQRARRGASRKPGNRLLRDPAFQNQPACTIPLEERLRMRQEFFARGGTITKCPPGIADGAVLPGRWSFDVEALVKEIHERTERGEDLEAVLGDVLRGAEMHEKIEVIYRIMLEE